MSSSDTQAAGIEADRDEILRLHREWWEANRTMDHVRMRECFAEGDSYYQFNLNGHPYYGITEKVQLWEDFEQKASTIPEFGPDEHLRLEIRGDMAWLACENVVQIEAPAEMDLGDLPRTPFRVRSTEIYQREDGAGGVRWRMWHHHSSSSAAPDEPRPPFGDTYETRSAQEA
jgi:hypothetical protein